MKRWAVILGVSTFTTFFRSGVSQSHYIQYLLFISVAKFVTTDEFRALNVGFSLDEGIASPTEQFNVYYAERTIWEIEFECHGQSGHGLNLFKGTPGEKLHYIIDKFMKFRNGEINKLENNPELALGDVTSVNLTMIKGGTQGALIAFLSKFEKKN